jgi:hypothetical protein
VAVAQDSTSPARFPAPIIAGGPAYVQPAAM